MSVSKAIGIGMAGLTDPAHGPGSDGVEPNLTSGKCPLHPAHRPEEAKPASDQTPDLVDGLGGEGVALDLQALQVFRQPHLEPEDFQGQVGVFQEPPAVLGVLGGDQRFEQPVEVPLDPFAQNETMVAGELAGVVAGPEDQVVSLR